MAAAAEGSRLQVTHVSDLPEECLALAIALTSPRDASRCAAVSPAFRAAADSDHVWQRFIPKDHGGGHFLSTSTTKTTTTTSCNRKKKKKQKKDAYLGLCDAAAASPVDGGGGGCRVWLDRATGAKCYALSARTLSLPWDDGEFSWRFTPHPRSRFAEDVAELVECTCLDIYGRLRASLLTPATPYAAYLVYGSAEGGHRGLSFPDQETAVAVGGQVTARRAVCLWPDDDEARKFRGGAAAAAGVRQLYCGDQEEGGLHHQAVGRPRLREDAWWEVEMGRLRTTGRREEEKDGHEEEQEVVASFEALGWYPKRGLVLHAIEFRPLHQ